MIFDPLQDELSRLELVDHMGTDQSVVRAARVSLGHDYGVDDEQKAVKLIRYLLAHQHWSPFQHCALTVMVALPIPIAREWMRHWTWAFCVDDEAVDASYNEISRRYTDVDIQFHYPPVWRTPGASNRQAAGEPVQNWRVPYINERYTNAIREAERTYAWMLDQGVCREQARFVLPQALYTRMYATVNLRSALHFIGLRDAADAQVEIQEYARALSAIVQTYWPLTWTAWQEVRGA